MCHDDPQEEETATHFNIFAWKIPITKKPAGFSPEVCKKLDTAEHSTYYINLHIGIDKMGYDQKKKKKKKCKLT